MSSRFPPGLSRIRKEKNVNYLWNGLCGFPRLIILCRNCVKPITQVPVPATRYFPRFGEPRARDGDPSVNPRKDRVQSATESLDAAGTCRREQSRRHLWNVMLVLYVRRFSYVNETRSFCPISRAEPPMNKAGMQCLRLETVHPPNDTTVIVAFRYPTFWNAPA